MSDTIWIDNIPYHAYEEYLYEQGYPLIDNATDEPVTELFPMLDENEEMIPKTVCLCASHNEFECCCGAWNYDLSDEE